MFMNTRSLRNSSRSLLGNLIHKQPPQLFSIPQLNHAPLTSQPPHFKRNTILENSYKPLTHNKSNSQIYVFGGSHFDTETMESLRLCGEYLRPEVIALELCDERLKTLFMNGQEIMESINNLSDFEQACIREDLTCVGHPSLNEIFEIQDSGSEGLWRHCRVNGSESRDKLSSGRPKSEFDVGLELAQENASRLWLIDRPTDVCSYRLTAYSNNSGIEVLDSAYTLARVYWSRLTTEGFRLMQQIMSFSTEPIIRAQHIIVSYLKEHVQTRGRNVIEYQINDKERDVYMVGRLRQLLRQHITEEANAGSPGIRVLLVVGSNHIDGIRLLWDYMEENEIDLTTEDLQALCGSEDLPSHLNHLVDMCLLHTAQQVKDF